MQDTWRGVILKEVNRVQLCGNPPERAIIALCPEMHCHAKQRVERDPVECSGGEKLYVLENNCSSRSATWEKCCSSQPSCSGELRATRSSAAVERSCMHWRFSSGEQLQFSRQNELQWRREVKKNDCVQEWRTTAVQNERFRDNCS